MDLEDAKRKIQALLDLADNNPSQEEAFAAMQAARRIMARYHIEQADLKGDAGDTRGPDEVTSKSVGCGKRRTTWRSVVANAVASHNRCFTTISRKPAYLEDTGKVEQWITFHGFPEDVNAAIALYKAACSVCDYNTKAHLAECAEKDPYWGRSDGRRIGNTFRLGFGAALKDAFSAQDKQDDCTALVLSSTPKAVKEYKQGLGLGKPKKTAVNVWSSDSYAAGQRAGRAFGSGLGPRPLTAGEG